MTTTRVYVPNWLNTTDHYAYIVGYEDGEVKPNNNITRAEVATIFFRLLTDDARAYYWSTDSGFSDVNPGDWYNTAVATMVQAGILNGYSDGTFKPNASITRAEFATIAARFLSNPYFRRRTGSTTPRVTGPRCTSTAPRRSAGSAATPTGASGLTELSPVPRR